MDYFIAFEGEGTPQDPIALAGDPIIMGRDPAVDLTINSSTVSRQHARIRPHGGDYVIEDMNSSNGTFVNGVRIEQPIVLQDRDVVQLGSTIRFTYTAAAPSAVATLETAAVGRGATVLDEDMPSLTDAQTAPRLTVTVAGEEAATARLEKAVVTLGRAPDNDIVVQSPIVSRYHARIEEQNGAYTFVPLPEAGNPVLFEGRPMAGPRMLFDGDLLRIGSMDPGVMVTLSYSNPAEAEARQEALDIDFTEANQLTVGRDASNDIVLNSPRVSRYHAQIERIGQRFRIIDLQSSNGVFVNNTRIEGESWLDVDDVVSIGPYRFVLGEDEIAQFDESGEMMVDVIGLQKWVRPDLNILQDISLSINPREFVVVVGQSGGGKSTLVDAIAGYRPATDGRVLVNGIDVYENFDAIRSDIGFVPQKDIIHMELTVYQALDYAARLRMPADTSKEERHERVMAVLEDLDIAHRADVQISGLSGGQQKRVSIGVELLTKPRLFFLDEPSSGLDPGTETALMHLMRRLADQGRIIVLITHATKNVMLADKVIFLARGGYLAWFGPPDEALHYFDQFRSERERRSGAMEFDDIYAILDDPANGTADEWAQRYRQSQAHARYISAPLAERAADPPDPKPTKGREDAKRTANPLRQFRVLSSRNLRILMRDRASLMLMLGAPLIGVLDIILALVLGPNPFNFGEGGDVGSALIIQFILPLYGVMVGGLAMMREIVKEADIYKRERLVNLKILPYVLSKVQIAVLLAFYHALIYVIIRYIAFNMPGGVIDFVLVYITMFVTTFAGMMLGLFASAISPNANAAPLITILFILPQIVIGGALIPVPQAVSAPTITRWGFEGLMAVSGVGSDVARDPCWALEPGIRDNLSLEEKLDNNCLCLGPEMIDEDVCNFPGLGQFYSEALDEAPPVEPAPLGPEPERPDVPERPVEPEDQSDQVAMAQYFEDLETWEAEVTQIQTDYEAEVDRYRAEADIYQEEVVAFQTTNAQYQAERQAAVGGGEAWIRGLYNDYRWTFVDKENPTAYAAKMATVWGAQAAISSILLTAIVVAVKRKDTN